MSYYELPKQERASLFLAMGENIRDELAKGRLAITRAYFGDNDTYIRKCAYLSLGRIYFNNKELQQPTIDTLGELFSQDDFRIRQSVINAAGEIGKKDLRKVQHFFDQGLFDKHHSPRNAVIGSIKKMGEVNPEPVLKWARQYLHHADNEIRRQICHGIELRGRKHPQDILPLLRELQYDKAARVRKTLVHVIGQIAYKKGCLQTVVEDLKTWENKQLVSDALEEIIDVHSRYRNFSTLTQEEAKQYIELNCSCSAGKNENQ